MKESLILHLHNNLLNPSTQYREIILGGLTKILAVSNYVKESISMMSDIEIQTIHNGIDTSKYNRKAESLSDSRRKLGFTDEDFVIVFSGRIIKEKGISELIDAMNRLKDHSNIKLMILGTAFFNDVNNEDTFMRDLKAKSEPIRKNIVFTGFVPYDLVPSYLHLADIAVLPSMWEEPFGLTVVEAMAAGLPLITTHSGGIPELCEGVATIVERQNIVEGLTTAILNLYNHPEKRKQMSAAGIERARLFDKEEYARKFFATFNSEEKPHQKLAVLTCGMLPIPAVQGGAVENLIDFYLEYNDSKKLHDITIYSPWHPKVANHPLLKSDVNHFYFVNVSSFRAKIGRRLYKLLHKGDYYNYFIEYYFERVYADLKKHNYDYIILENCPGYVVKLSRGGGGGKNLILHLNNDLLNSTSRFHDEVFNGLDTILTCSDYIKNKVLTIRQSTKVQTLYNAINVFAFMNR